jgi:N,N'-diacetyllegionaminate synthase
MRTAKIGKKTIGGGARCFIIAEAGSNHNGRFDMACRLIDVAARAGADAVKFQTFRAAKLYTSKAGRSDYLRLKKPIYDVIREMEMPYAWIPRLADHCRRRKVTFLSTPFDEESADRLDPYVEAFKIASYEMTHYPLLKHVARLGKPLLISTGTATEAEVAEAVAVAHKAQARGLCLLQCTAAYPAPLASINVRVLQRYKARFGVPAGLSDHSRDPIVAPMTAAALGADLLEKHFTLRNDLQGPDHRYAVTPAELADLVRRVREVEEARGDFRKRVHPVERELRRFARRSLFASRDIPVGARLTPQNVGVLRNGAMRPGLPPADYGAVIGRIARREVLKGESITSAVLGR